MVQDSSTRSWNQLSTEWCDIAPTNDMRINFIMPYMLKLLVEDFFHPSEYVQPLPSGKVPVIWRHRTIELIALKRGEDAEMAAIAGMLKSEFGLQ